MDAVIHGEGEYVEDAHANTCESHASLVRRWLSLHRGVSKDKLTLYLRAFQLCRRIFHKLGQDALKEIVRTVLSLIDNVLHMNVERF